MANILFRASTSAPIPTSTSAKLTPLTNLEVDGNFRSLNQGLTDLQAAVPSLTGTGASGTWGISITGNAGTVTNGVYTTGSYSDPSWITSLSGSKVTNAVLTTGSYANPDWLTALAGTKVTGAVLTSGLYANPSWITSLSYEKVGIPSVSGQGGKVLTTNGTGLQWAVVSGGGTGVDTNTTYSISAALADLTPSIQLTAANPTSYDNVKFAAGSNVSIAVTDSSTITISSSFTDTNTTYTLSAAQSSSNANIQLTPSTGGAQTVQLIAGSNITLGVTGNAITINSTGGPGGTDTYYTYALSAVSTTGGANLRNTQTQFISGTGQTPTTADITFSSGSGITVSRTSASQITIAHTDTSTATNLVASARTYVTGLEFDTFGHVSSYTTGTETVTDTNFYPTTWTWSNGTTSGPTASLSGVGMTAISVGAVPTATASQAGIVTTGSQTFAGSKTFNGAVSLGSTLGVSGNTTMSGTLQVTGAISSQGDITAFASSDTRLKENVQVLENALDKVKTIRGVEFDWTDQYLTEINPNVKKHDVGVIAQEVEHVLPEVVGEMSSGYKGVRYDRLVPLLIEAIKELSARIEELEAR